MKKKTNKKGTMTNKLQEKINDYLKKIIKADDDYVKNCFIENQIQKLYDQ